MVEASPVHKIMLIDHHQLVLDGIENLLIQRFPVTIVSRVTNGLDVYSECQKSQPNIILLDLNLPGMNGIDIIIRVKRQWPSLSILVITANKILYKVHEAMTAGAQAYVLKQRNQQIFFSAFQAVISGKQFIDPNLNFSTASATVNTQLPISQQGLTCRELQVLKLISEGYKNREIAESLSISIKTVAAHRLNLMKKLDVHNIAGMVAWSTRLGLIEI